MASPVVAIANLCCIWPERVPPQQGPPLVADMQRQTGRPDCGLNQGPEPSIGPWGQTKWTEVQAAMCCELLMRFDGITCCKPAYTGLRLLANLVVETQDWHASCGMAGVASLCCIWPERAPPQQGFSMVTESGQVGCPLNKGPHWLQNMQRQIG